MYKTFHANRSPDSQVHNIFLCYGRKTEPPWLAYSRKQGDVVTSVDSVSVEYLVYVEMKTSRNRLRDQSVLKDTE